jgi:hypothetical protein
MIPELDVLVYENLVQPVLDFPLLQKSNFPPVVAYYDLV